MGGYHTRRPHYEHYAFYFLDIRKSHFVMPIHFEHFWKNTPRIQTTIDNIVCFISMDNRNSHFVMPTFRDFRGKHLQTTLDNTMGFISIDIRKLHFVMPTFQNFQGNTPPDYISKCFGSIFVPPDNFLFFFY